jgi:hypothetical protein
MDYYGTEEGFEAWLEATGTDVPSGDALPALLRASLALDAMYGWRFVGTRATYTQDREWPRVDANWPDGTAVSGVPPQVEYANYELAYQEMLNPGVLSPIVTPGKVKRRARVEGAVDVSYVVGAGTAATLEAMTPVLTRVEGLLQHLIGSRRPLPGILVV